MKPLNEKNTLGKQNISHLCSHLGGIGTCGRILCCRKFLRRPLHEEVNLTPEEKQDLPVGLCGQPKCCALWERKIASPPLASKKELPKKEKTRKKMVRRIVK